MTAVATSRSALKRGVRKTVILLSLTAIGFYVAIIVMMRSAGT